LSTASSPRLAHLQVFLEVSMLAWPLKHAVRIYLIQHVVKLL
jgi:hypothetical protein